jgi:hypothetical protein
MKYKISDTDGKYYYETATKTIQTVDGTPVKGEGEYVYLNTVGNKVLTARFGDRIGTSRGKCKVRADELFYVNDRGETLACKIGK